MKDHHNIDRAAKQAKRYIQSEIEEEAKDLIINPTKKQYHKYRRNFVKLLLVYLLLPFTSAWSLIQYFYVINPLATLIVGTLLATLTLTLLGYGLLKLYLHYYGKQSKSIDEAKHLSTQFKSSLKKEQLPYFRRVAPDHALCRQHTKRLEKSLQDTYAYQRKSLGIPLEEILLTKNSPSFQHHALEAKEFISILLTRLQGDPALKHEFKDTVAFLKEQDLYTQDPKNLDPALPHLQESYDVFSQSGWAAVRDYDITNAYLCLDTFDENSPMTEHSSYDPATILQTSKLSVNYLRIQYLLEQQDNLRLGEILTSKLKTPLEASSEDIARAISLKHLLSPDFKPEENHHRATEILKLFRNLPRRPKTKDLHTLFILLDRATHGDLTYNLPNEDDIFDPIHAYKVQQEIDKFSTTQLTFPEALNLAISFQALLGNGSEPDISRPASDFRASRAHISPPPSPPEAPKTPKADKKQKTGQIDWDIFL